MIAALSFENRRVLELNKNWTPIGTISLQDALTKLVSTYDSGKPKAMVIDAEEYRAWTWADWANMRPAEGEDVIKTGKHSFKIPEVILLAKFDKTKQPRNSFNRRMLFKRDNYTCQYCGRKPGSEELNIDHVLPRSRGGLTTWENCVLSCVECNSRKADKLLKDTNMILAKTPQKPRCPTIKGESLRMDSWQAWLGEMYWTTPLID